MKKSTTAGLVLAALAGTTIMMIGGASAANAAPGDGGALRPLISAGTITSSQARAVHDQLTTDCEAAKAASRDTALTTLVTEGTLTQTQADAVAATDREGIRALVQAGTITKAQAEAIKAEVQEYGTAKTDGRTASLAKLVSSGTITQAQSEAIAAALPAPGSKPKPADRMHAPQGPRGAGAPVVSPAA